MVIVLKSLEFVIDEDYCIEMNRREYQRGLKNGQQVTLHILTKPLTPKRNESQF